MVIKGRMKYVPPNILDELRNIKVEDNIPKDSDALKKMAEYSIVGREVKKMRDRLLLKDLFENEKKR